MKDTILNQIMACDKREADFAYKIVFLQSDDTIESVINSPLAAFRGRKIYTYVALEECKAADVVIASAAHGNSFNLSLAIVVERLDKAEIVNPDYPLKGMILHKLPYISYLRQKQKYVQDMQRKKAELLHRIELEKEKIVLRQLGATNPELLSEIEDFQKSFPNELIVKDL